MLVYTHVLLCKQTAMTIFLYLFVRNSASVIHSAERAISLQVKRDNKRRTTDYHWKRTDSWVEDYSVCPIPVSNHAAK